MIKKVSFNKIAKENGAKVFNYNTKRFTVKNYPDIEEIEDNTNTAYYHGLCKEITIGFIKSYNEQVYSFFHELAHHLDDKKNNHFNKRSRIQTEKRAWKNGLKLMNKYGVDVEPDFIYFSNKCLETYK